VDHAAPQAGRHRIVGPVIPARFRLPLALLAATVGTGVVGYRLIEGWTWLEAVWMVGITLTTIGFGEVHPLSPAGRVFTLVLIGGGISIVSYTFTEFARYVVEGELRRAIEARRWRAKMDRMQDHHVVIGFGRLGREVAQELRHSGVAVVVVENDPALVQTAESRGFVTVAGDATSDDTLRLARIELARGVAIATSSNATNVFLTLSVRQLNGKALILTRVDDDETANKARRAGADHVLSPQGIGGAHMAHAMLRPHARAFLDLATSRHFRELEIDDVPCGGVPRALRELQVAERFGVLVVAIRRPDGTLRSVPTPTDTLGMGDIAVVLGRPEQIRSFAAAVR
jgi:voltage-gated potassium channel